MFPLAVLALFFGQANARPPAGLQLRIEAPPELTAIRGRLESIDPQRFADLPPFLGMIPSAVPAIHVVLAAENSDLARGVPPWISGFAVGESDLVVMFPTRSLIYPNDTLEDVLRHEIAHVLIWHASGSRSIPRWFDEGLAMAVERERRLEDQTQLLYQLVTGPRTSLEELNRLFRGGQSDQTRAYALAGALVHDVLQEHGPAACGEILMRVSRGAQFDAAFSDVIGLSPADVDSRFWLRQRIWTAWVPLVTSSTTLWLGVTMLAILAIYIRRRRNRELEEQWAKEDDDVD